MSEMRCQETRTRLHAWRVGELPHLERQAMGKHLEGCQSCTAELWLQTELENAAKCGPEPLTDAKKRELWRGIQRRILEVPSSTATPTFLWPRRWVPAVATAVAVLAVVGGLTLGNIRASLPPPTVARGWLTQEPDVQAFATTPARAAFGRQDGQPVLRVTDGTLVVRFERRPDSAPLEVETPDIKIIVRGTVFSIMVVNARSTVSVQHGRVEVQSTAGETVFVNDDEEALATPGGLVQQPSSPARRQAMIEVFGRAPAPETSALVTAPATIVPALSPTPTAATRPPVVTKVTPAESAALTVDPVELARGKWRAGDATTAMADLRALLQQPDLLPRHREEALYLAATIQRELRQYRDAAAAFAELMHSDAATPTVRLARLERARILGQHLDEKTEALRELDLLAGDGGRDAVADAASFERCAILIEQHRLEPARACLTGYLVRFEDGSHVGECAILLDRLSRSTTKGSPP
jgi:hypothetical protein